MRNFFPIILIFFSMSALCQIGGNSTYGFLNLTNSARVASLGGKTIAIDDNDLNLATVNPSLLNASMHNSFALNYVDYLTDINFGYAAFAYKYDAKNTFAAGVQYINYGTFEKADATGQIQGKFYAAEDALNLIYSHRLDSNFSLGVNFKPIYSTLESYTSFGFATDIGAHYTSPDGLFTGALVLRSMGTQIKRYTPVSGYEPLPFEIIGGFSKKFKYAPFRIVITTQQLQKLKMTYTDSAKAEIDPLTGNIVQPAKLANFADNMMRHVILGVEFLPFKNFYFRVGYNYQRRKEMQLPDKIGAVGFSWGFGMKINKFNISYGRSSYHMAGGTNHFTIAVNLSEFYRRSNSSVPRYKDKGE
jgi:hypothetical protein